MKKFKKLIPALCMLLVSAVMLGSTTFAWFSMNKTVTAGNMQINATTNEPYLLVGSTVDGTFGTNATLSVDPAASTALKLVTPLNVASNVAYYKDATDAQATNTTTPTKFTNAGKVLWGTASSTDPTDAQKNKVPNLVGGDGFNNGELKNYVQKSELFFKVAATDQKGKDLKCSKVTFTNTNGNTIAKSLRVLFVTEDGKYQLFKYGTTGGVITTAETGSDAALIETVDTTALKVTAYFYFDGTDDDAYTNKATKLTDVSVSFEFTIV